MVSFVSRLVALAIAVASLAAVPAVAVPLAEATSTAAPVVRRLDGASTLIVQTWKDGAAARLAHDHAILAPTFSGEVVYAAGAPEQSRIVVDVDR